MDSGDLGYWADGELFITGREKDLIIKAGRNIRAEEVEQVAGMVPGIRKGCVAAFGVRDPAIGTERLVVVAETRERDADCRKSLRTAVLDRLVDDIGMPADVVLIVDPGTVLKTPTGKIRRSATRDAYVGGTLDKGSSFARQWSRLQIATLGGRVGRLAGWLGRVVFTGYVAFVLIATLPVLWLYLVALRPGPHAERAAKRWSRIGLMLCGLRLRVVGLHNLDGLRAGILLANHASFIDPIVLMAAIPLEFQFVAKRRLADYPLLGTVIRKAGHLTIEKADVTRRLAGAEEVAKLAGGSRWLMMFPEGTFVRPRGLLPFRLGAFRAAVETGRFVVPIAIRGTRHILPDGTRMFRHGPIEVTIGVPLRPQATGWQEMVRLRDVARAEIAKHSGEETGGDPTMADESYRRGVSKTTGC